MENVPVTGKHALLFLVVFVPLLYTVYVLFMLFLGVHWFKFVIKKNAIKGYIILFMVHYLQMFIKTYLGLSPLYWWKESKSVFSSLVLTWLVMRCRLLYFFLWDGHDCGCKRKKDWQRICLLKKHQSNRWFLFFFLFSKAWMSQLDCFIQTPSVFFNLSLLKLK